MGQTARGTYDRPRETVLTALLDGLPETRLRPRQVDKKRGFVRATTRVTWLSWGEKVTISVKSRGPEQTEVTMESGFKVWMTHDLGQHRRNFAEVFGMLDRRLGTLHHVPPGMWADR
jgi:hypothetical protein